ncbi:MAG TPA: FkbM family methyltransferase [Caulobacteraceae bacterium]|nr:FkbM family methyltransferase [Caulobacteraceae bacterium]
MGRYKLYVDGADVGFGANVLLDGLWESWLTVFMARRVKAGMAVADVGANHGYYSLLFADLVGEQGRVAAIEPNPAVCHLLRRSLVLNGFSARVTVLEAAAAAEEGHDVELYAPPGESKNGRVVNWAGFGSGREHSVPVPAVRLSTALSRWDRLDFVKMDVEGAEQRAAEGLRPLLERDRPDFVLEYHPLRCPDPEALLGWLGQIYGRFRSIEFDGEAHPRRTSELLDGNRKEDWILYLSSR